MKCKMVISLTGNVRLVSFLFFPALRTASLTLSVVTNNRQRLNEGLCSEISKKLDFDCTTEREARGCRYISRASLSCSLDCNRKFFVLGEKNRRFFLSFVHKILSLEIFCTFDRVDERARSLIR